MKRRIRRIAAAVASMMLVPWLALSQDKPGVMIPAGSTLHVRLGTTLTSKTNKTGDTFTGMVMQPIVVDSQEVIPRGSFVNGHVAFVKPSGRIRGKAEMRIVLDDLVTPEDLKYLLSAGLQEAKGVPCGANASDEEGTIEGCGKSLKKAAKQAAIGAGIGAGAGAVVGLSTRGGCSYYGCWPGSGPGMGTDVMYGAGIGAGTALLYNLFRHEKHIILVQGTELTFVINRNVDADAPTPAAGAAKQ